MTRFRFIRADSPTIPDDRRYQVWLANELLGEVVAGYRASHIRRGRLQTSPWWQAVRNRELVAEPRQRRVDAAWDLVELAR
jgi:hypothetical protein